ncbi:hypothetical protein G4B88_001218 [Cannabis sativa]|uniref:Uncharacterized protein n=1 Tax=Cannabis sativa TaxID=3483 RepID=A0A7J6ED42_CANSA|nr:hypothetical protein G4B88_001218 [Cannabis sativa]
MGDIAEAEDVLQGNRRGSLAPTLIFAIVIAFQFLSRWLEHLKKKGSKSATEIQLREEIKKLMKEASILSQLNFCSLVLLIVDYRPATFAQAAKLRRMAVAKEKELMKYQESHKNEQKVSCELYSKVFFFVKMLTYLVLVCWFWRVPVATISEQLVQPFGKVLSWKGGGILNDNVMVGIIPWLILSTRVSKFICKLFKF